MPEIHHRDFVVHDHILHMQDIYHSGFFQNFHIRKSMSKFNHSIFRNIICNIIKQVMSNLFHFWHNMLLKEFHDYVGIFVDDLA